MTDQTARWDPGTRDGAKRSKRSQTVSLVLVAGAGAAALGLAKIDWSQREEDVLVYSDVAACVSERVRPEGECHNEFAIAQGGYPTAAPRYASLSDCEGHHGAQHCVTGQTVTETARNSYLPRMAGYMIGRRAEQGITPQPVFDHAPRPGHAASHAGHGGYCTGSGTRLYGGSGTGGGTSSARVHSSAVRNASFGGLGGTGRSFASSSSHGSFGGG